MSKNNRWISTNERLPEIGQEVLACFKEGETTLVFISSRKNETEWDGGNGFMLNTNSNKRLIATHWMPLL